MNIKYRITKYNPIYRDITGKFQNDEWIAISDIGRNFNGKELSMETYLDIEKNYIDVIKMIMIEKGINEVRVKELEKSFTLSEVCEGLRQVQIYLSQDERCLFSEVNEGYKIELSNIDSIIRLLLRENLWCKLVNTRYDFSVEFGYDYYMYVFCSRISNLVIDKIKNRGLFIEELY